MRYGGYVYILASGRAGTLYIGVTNDLERRMHEHRNGLVPGFAKRYGVDRLVWFEGFDRIEDAIAREKRLKNWNRDWKLNLIESANSHWSDLALAFAGPLPS